MLRYGILSPLSMRGNGPKPHHQELIKQWGLDTDSPKEPRKPQPAARKTEAQPKIKNSARENTTMTKAEKRNATTNEIINLNQKLAHAYQRQVKNLEIRNDFTNFDEDVQGRMNELENFKTTVIRNGGSSVVSNIQKINGILHDFKTALDMSFNRFDEKGLLFV